MGTLQETHTPLPATASPRAPRHLLELLDALPVAAYTCDCRGLITYFNRTAVSLWGREPRLNDPVDRYCGSFKLFTPDGVPVAHDQCWMAQALHHDSEFIAQEILVERPDGVRLAVLAHAKPLRDDAGERIGAINILSVVGPHRESETVRAQLAAIVQSSDDAIVSKSLDGKIQTWNAGAERIFGYTPEEAIGQHITLIIPPDRRDEEREILAKLTRGERIDHLETVRIAKNGQRLFVSLTTSPLHDGAGRVVGASKVARDITLRKQNEQALAALSEQRASQLADMARVRELGSRLWTAQELKPILDETLRTATAILGTDLGTVLMVDRDANQLVLGASLGLGPDFVSAVETLPLGNGAYGRCAAQGQPVVIEDIEQDTSFELSREMTRAEGVRAVHSTPLVTRSGEVVGVLTTMFRRPHRPAQRELDLLDLCTSQAVDFIENAQLHSRLREADERKNQFLAILAHELRNPLAPIRNALELIRRDPDPSTLERTHGMMERQVLTMVRLIDDLIDVSRVTRGRFILKKEPTTLSAVLESAIESCRPAIEAAGHRLTTSLPTESVLLDGDPTRLSQVFANLLGNAAKYTPDGGRIWVDAERTQADRVVIRVRDDGLGIPPNALASIFEIFMQVGDAFERSQGGLGIGLSLARGLIELHGGTIAVHSEGLGKGSEFVVTLPTLAEPPRSAAAATPEATEADGGPALHILVVDDNEDAASSFSLLVRRLGHETRTARDGVEALQVAAEFRPEIVFLDIGLPKLNGYEVARAIRGQSWGRSVFLIALTGWGQEDDKRLAFESGFDLHLVKPVDPASVGELIMGYRRQAAR
ncbi:MAG TPA: PAS domain S-box protein [Candidatus Eisenbacteria bacterium]|nr:PAS domain S-box protein [Candidatus Eisenbacteria bacterium]